MHDLVIRGGDVVDGEGAPARVADVAVDGGVITAVGPALGPAWRDIDAEGLLVTPGFVDIHTHYDGQATWDAQLTSSCWHGVTTAVFGNCGVGFAPVRPGSTDFLINLMEGVEDIPGTVLAEGVRFDWESFPDYLDALDRAPHGLDIAAQVPHAALRFYAMGDEGADHEAVPDARCRERMSDLLAEALRAGALGFTTSRTRKHRTRDGRAVPSLSAHEPELEALARGMRRAGSGVFEINSDLGPGEFELMRAFAETSGRPLSILMVQSEREPDLWRQVLDKIHLARADGLAVNAQVGCRAVGVLVGLETSANPFAGRPPWRALSGLTPAQRVQRLREDDDLRRQLIEAPGGDAISERLGSAFEKLYPLGPDLDYEPTAGVSVGARARTTGRSPWDIALNLMMREEGKAMLLHPVENYAHGDYESVREMLVDDATIMGVADGGAHVGYICDASSPTYLLSHWARDRRRGPRLPLEYVVKKQTHDTAAAYGLHDRGVLAPGRKADLNIIDFANLGACAPEVRYDLPAGGRRLVQRARGYRHTFVSGVEVLRDDELTGATPGVLVRGGSGRSRGAGGSPRE